MGRSLGERVACRRALLDPEEDKQPDQHGSASIKAAIPALTRRSYDDLVIQQCDTASWEFVRVHFGDAPEPERQQVRRDLEIYCGQDTEAMVWIVEALQRVAG